MPNKLSNYISNIEKNNSKFNSFGNKDFQLNGFGAAVTFNVYACVQYYL